MARGRRFRGGAGRCGRAAAGVLLAGLVPAAAVLAEVTLDTAVSKVETTLDGTGRVKRELVPAEDVVPGEELRYSITFSNDSETEVDAERIVIINPLPPGTEYVAGSAGGRDALVEYSTDGESFSTVEPAGEAGATTLPSSEGAGTGADEAAGGHAAGAVQSLRWTYQRALPPEGSGEVFFHVRMQ